MRLARRLTGTLAVALIATSMPAAAAAPAVERTAPVCGYEVVAVYPHDPGAFTEGLVFDDGTLLESTGIYGHSSLRRVELASGTVLAQHDLAPDEFGEGIAVVGERIFQLTYLGQSGFIYDRTTFADLGGFSYSGEGWGMAFDGNRLVRGDGGAVLELWDPVTVSPVGSLEVRDGQIPVTGLNELEYVAGEIFANVWPTDTVARIDPATGQVTAWVDLSGLLATQGGADGVDVLNGIAWDAAGRRLFVTGKWWPWLFEIALPECPIGLVFGDGFETGDLSRWDSRGTATVMATPREPARS